MEHTANQAAIRGSLLELPQFSHENHGNRFYRFVLEVPRLSGAVDHLPVIAPGRGLESNGSVRRRADRGTGPSPLL